MNESVSPPADTATAYHEAGHAVVALLLDRPVHRPHVAAVPVDDDLVEYIEVYFNADNIGVEDIDDEEATDEEDVQADADE